MQKRIAVAVAGLLVASVASAQEAAPGAAGYHTHDGFYLQLGLGGGGAASSASQGGLSVDLSGVGAVFNLAAGGAVNPSFLLGGRVFSAAVADPTVKLNGTTVDSSASSYGVVGYGVDLTYYFTPSNFYVSGTPALTRLTVTSGGDSSVTDWGFGLRLAAGKEWWVSKNWGLGLNLEYIRSENRDNGTGTPTWGTNWFGVAFSATYN